MIGLMAPAKNPWRCEVCKNLIELEPGHVELTDNSAGSGKPGGYPTQATPEFQPAPRDGFVDVGEGALEYFFEHLSREPSVRVQVTHLKCAVEPGGYGFVAPATLEGWLAWIFHLEEKTWMSHEDRMRMLRYWWTNRGQEIPHI